MSVYTRWYKDGTIAATNGSPNVTGSNTYWATAGLNPGDIVKIGGVDYELLSVEDNTHITLATNFKGNTASGLGYSIVRNFTATSSAKVAAQAAGLMGDFERYIDKEMQKINGKSAYEVAVANGYTGTAAQWLETLKAGGEWTAANTRISSLEDRVGRNNAGAHNSIYRGKNLGVFTEAQSAEIRAGTFTDIYCGDCYVFSNIPYTYLDANDEEQSSTYSGTMRAADLDYYLKAGDQGDGLTAHHVVVVPDTNMFTAPMNAENKTEGGYVGSKMRTVYLRRAEAIFKACFGENHVLKHREYLVNAVKDGRASAGAWCDSFVDLMDERMVYGAPQFDSSAPDGSENVVTTFHRYSVSCKQLNLFRHRPDLISNRQWYWLRNVVSAAYFAGVNFLGSCSYNHASYSGGGVRPAALIY